MTNPDPDSRLPLPASPGRRAGQAAALLFLGAVFLCASWRPLAPAPLWADLKFGQWIVDHQALPAFEPFSPYTVPAGPSLYSQWLGQAGLYLVFGAGEAAAGGDALQQTAGGVDLLRTGYGILEWLRYGILLLALVRLTGSVPLASAGAVLAWGLTWVGPETVQPRSAGELFFACLLLALARPVLSQRALLLIPLVLVVWANTHNSYLLGLILLAGCLAGRAIEAFRPEDTSQSRAPWKDTQVRRLLAVLVLSGVAVAFLNPEGPSLYLKTGQMIIDPNLNDLPAWKPLEFGEGHPAGWVYLGSLFLVVISQAVSPRPLSPARLVLLFLFAILPCVQQRLLVWWFMLLPWLVLPLWSALVPQLPPGGPPSPGLPRWLVTVLVILPLLGSPGAAWLLTGHPTPLERSLSPATPWKVADQLRGEKKSEAELPDLAKGLSRHYPGGRFTGRIQAGPAQGDYLLWALPPSWPVLLFSQADLFPVGFWEECRNAAGAGNGWWEVLDRYQVNLIVIDPGAFPKLAGLLREDPDWLVVAGPHPLLVALRKQPLISPNAE